MGLESEKDLEDERMRTATVISLFSLKVCFPPFKSGCLRVRVSEKILQIECSVEGQRLGAEYRPRKIKTRSSVTESSQKEVLCRGLRELGPTQNPVAHHRKGFGLVKCGHRR